MKTKFFYSIAILLLLPQFFYGQKSKQLHLPSLYAKGKLKVVNRGAQVIKEDSLSFLRITEDNKEGIVWLPIKEFKNGSIEIHMRGKDVLQKSFIGIAFHGLNDSTFDAVYCRPFNFFAKDSVRRIHAIQYIAHPVYTWKKLREEQNAIFEKEIINPPDPNGWFTMRLVIQGKTVNAFINDTQLASLSIEKRNDRKTGKLGLFVGDGSGGDFSVIRIW
jgi:hypothetical protein